MAKSLQELLASRSPESQARIQKWLMNYCWKLSFTLFVKS